MRASPTMMTFDTVTNPDFGCVEETGIMVTIADMYPNKTERHTKGVVKGSQVFRRLFDKTMIAIDDAVVERTIPAVKVALRRRKSERVARQKRTTATKESKE